MPKTLQYRDGAVIYFAGETNSEKIYLLQSGKVNLSYQDIENGENILDSVQKGEFFGVKSALGKYPREENAIAYQETTVMAFVVSEFEQLASSNTRIIMKMLKVFSNQQRRVHQQIANIMEKEGYNPENPEQSLYNVGEYYLKNKRFSQAKYIFGRYLTYYPSGKNAAKAAQNMQVTENSGQEAMPPPPPIRRKSSIGQAVAGENSSATAKAYYDAVSFISQGKFQQAFVALNQIVDAKEDLEYMAKSTYEIGRCLFMMNKFDECIQHFTIMITSYPKHPNLGDALYFIGQSHENRGMKDMAIVFYKKILSMIPDQEEPVHQKAKKALSSLGGA
ncbi:putative cyclic nucleotide-binding protein [Treponema primitia ZAS-2]|uniref:Putative cyclic nucleotide-binding protein n=1 Tax=Treponema primitia (strain ATCC BAA-887 / DSM 12427 / ZAS-2) TaxID=545694 RepID=F5YPM8_TREPZ|nr:tetratricopeptide repeat protein [Treponema primitia]AEF85797.1 putative cyclic nucleotide-binding protein [Treponema primitia ZAS-2]